MHGLSHLNALRAFEAVARGGSYVAAARELNVTPAAVGQQVRALEAWIGVPLFVRGKSGSARLMPTAAATDVLSDLRDGFSRLGTVLRRLREDGGRSVLTVSATPAFVSKWLLPRIEDFQVAHPDIELRLDVADRLVDFAPGGVDVGIRYGAGAWPGVATTPLLREAMFPVCSPALLSGTRPLREIVDLRGHVLIHDATAGAASVGFPGWRDWLALAGVNDVDTDRGPRINASATVIQAAIAGHGVALARSVLVAGDLASGLLTRPFPRPAISLERGWHVVHRADAALPAKVVVFRDWLLRRAAAAV